ncbi:MAG: hypothetical protein SWE60_09925 [Thermodesulfobacteriota bacterium]|nr:hypothetical protein [Thermodesulfobacteriota bacterium]
MKDPRTGEAVERAMLMHQSGCMPTLLLNLKGYDDARGPKVDQTPEEEANSPATER